ncbi:MAG: DUF1330 domain-containing protein [Hyphomicrobiales bacterium]
MTKGYWIARVDVSDMDAYKNYVTVNAKPLLEFGGRFLTRGGAFEAVEGAARQRNVVIEFPSYEAALACYKSAEYSAAKAIRKEGSEGELVIVEGYDGPQPGDAA